MSSVDDLATASHDSAPRQPVEESLDLNSAVVGLLGLVRGVLADGVVNEAEAHALRDWIAWHPEAATRWPLRAVARRLEEIFRDGRVDAEERHDLAELLRRLMVGTPGPPLRVARSIELPLDDPPPPLAFRGTVFVLVGRFASGSETSRIRRLRAAGALVEHEISPRTDVLVLGAFAGADLEEVRVTELVDGALALRRNGPRPVVVTEEHWMACLLGDRGTPGVP